MFVWYDNRSSAEFLSLEKGAGSGWEAAVHPEDAKSQLDEAGQIQISIHDTGPGLPVGKADQIFDAFFTTKPQGTGTGLAISKSIVELQGGRIWANGDGGRGATFHFTLPIATEELKVPAAET
jgi:signal transduction histidine kinase